MPDLAGLVMDSEQAVRLFGMHPLHDPPPQATKDPCRKGARPYRNRPSAAADVFETHEKPQQVRGGGEPG